MTLLLVGCTFDAGLAWAEITDGQLRAAYEPGEARDLGYATLTADGEEIVVDSMTLAAGTLILQDLSGGGSFDPAYPPEGYSLCHNGHCHAADGSLPSYAEVAAATGGATLTDLVSWPIDAELDLLAGEQIALQGAELPEAFIGQVQLTASAFYVTGESSEGPFDLEVALTSITAGAELDTYWAPPTFAIDITLERDGTVFDDMNVKDPQSEQLLEAVLSTNLTLEVLE